MRIAIIGAKGIPFSQAQGGGIERHVEYLAQKLVERGHRVTVYVRPYANPERKKSWQGVRLITLPSIRSKHLDAITHVFISSIHVLFQDVDIIHYHGVGPSLLSWIPRLFKWRVKVVVTFHSRDRFAEKWKVFARTMLAVGEWTACAFPHLTIAVSHAIKLYCEQMFGKPVVYIPNAVDIPSRVPGTSKLKALGLEPGGYLITLGRLIPLKAHDDAMRAFREVRTEKKLLILGEAPFDDISYQLRLEELARQDPRVVMMGFRHGEELSQIIAHCFCMIHPSRAEGLSVAVLEVMSYGKLVIMSDIPGNRELVDHSGISYPVGNIKVLAEAINWALHDELMTKTRGERGQDAVKKLYSWKHVIERTEQEYEKLLA